MDTDISRRLDNSLMQTKPVQPRSLSRFLSSAVFPRRIDVPQAEWSSGGSTLLPTIVVAMYGESIYVYQTRQKQAC